MSATGEFHLSIMKALADQLDDGLGELEPEPLDLGRLSGVEHKPGVYQLYKDGVLVYIGKDESSVAKRLREHYDKIKCRLNIAVSSMTFTALYVHEDLHAVAPEKRLINHYKQQGLASWNGKGFGPHDPGRKRDETEFGPTHFDSMYPADLGWVCEEISSGTYSADVLLGGAKESLPFVFRYQAAAFHKEVEVIIPKDRPTADEVFELLGLAINAADSRWRITALPGYVIMYPKPGPYPGARKQYPAD